MRGSLTSPDDLVPGPKYTLPTQAKELGLVQTPQGRYVLEASKEKRFFVSSLASGQLLWEADEPVHADDVKEILEAMTALDQSVHVNTGTHGTEDGELQPAGGKTFEFYLEDFGSITELAEKAKVSLHQVTSLYRPCLPPKANMVINGWCYSHRYGFASKVDLATGKIPEDKHVGWKRYCNLPRRLREVMKSLLGDEEGVDDAMGCYIETCCTSIDPEIRATAGEPSAVLLDRFL